MTTFIVSNHTSTLEICRNCAFLMLVALVTSLLLPVYWGGLLFIALGGVGFIAGYRKQGVYVVIAGTVACYWGWHWSAGLIEPSCFRSEVAVTGSVASLPVRYRAASGEAVQSFKLAGAIDGLVGCGSPVSLMVYGVSAAKAIPLGADVALKGRLAPNSSQWNLGSTPDQAQWLARGIYGRLNASEVALLTVSTGYLSHLREKLAKALEDFEGPSRAVGLLEALVLGTGRSIVQRDWERFRFLGMTHAFVVSGLHLSLVFFGIWLFSRRALILIWPHGLIKRDWAIIPALSVATIYAGLAGFSLPTQRALIMLFLGGILRLTARRTTLWHIFITAALIILITNYFAILGRSFWLSMAATGILIGLLTALAPKNFPHLRGWLLRVIFTQIALVLFMAPVTVFWFGKMTLAAVVANILLVPLIASLMIPLALVGTVCVLLWHSTDNLPWQLAVDVGMGVLRSAEALQQIIPESAMFNPFNGVALHRPEDATIELSVLDVGQGLSVVLTAAGQTLVYDTGDAPPLGSSQAQKVLIPYLNRLGAKDIAIRVISHSDRDHAGGVADLEAQFSTERAVGYAGTPCRVGEVLFQRAELTVTVLNGPGDDNDGSCVLQVRYAGVTILLAGDVSAAREREMIRYWRNELKAQVLVVAHHGSDTSTATSFLKWVDPTFAVISAGRANRFGHPRGGVLRRLEQRGIGILNTAREGGVTVTVQPQEMNITALRDGNIPYWLSLP
ncbi:MAG: ComEC/Rec2 family competence protein [Luminiphilus sp.]|nr:ComEC/Rec2 family competence protein [Luminiphilus sp.]